MTIDKNINSMRQSLNDLELLNQSIVPETHKKYLADQLLIDLTNEILLIKHRQKVKSYISFRQV